MISKKDLLKRIESLENKSCKEPEPIVSCDGCGCLIYKRHTKKVEHFSEFGVTTSDYCGNCSPKYDKIVHPRCFGNNTDDFRFYSKEQREVDKTGKLIKK